MASIKTLRGLLECPNCGSNPVFTSTKHECLMDYNSSKTLKKHTISCTNKDCNNNYQVEGAKKSVCKKWNEFVELELNAKNKGE